MIPKAGLKEPKFRNFKEQGKVRDHCIGVEGVVQGSPLSPLLFALTPTALIGPCVNYFLLIIHLTEKADFKKDSSIPPSFLSASLLSTS